MGKPNTPNREAAARGGAKSSRKGIPNKKTQAVTDRLAELGCDPLELSAKIALGKELDGPHPQLAAFRILVRALQEALQDSVMPEHLPKMAAITMGLTSLVEDYLTRGYVPVELRSKHIADLMQYAHSKRKAIDVTTGDEPLNNLVSIYLPANGRDE
jgi:hypothetical protein